MKIQIAFLGTMVAGALGLSAMSQAAPSVSEPAPGFSLQDSQGKTHQLSDYKGKYVVLEWFNNQCPFVRKHYDEGHMQALQKKYGEKGVVWLTINSSAPGKEGHETAEQANAQVAENKAAAAAYLLDPEGTVGKLYEAKTTPHMYVINPEGVLIYQGAIDDKKSADPKDIKKSKNYVSAALDEAMAGKKVAKAVTSPYGCSVKYN